MLGVCLHNWCSGIRTKKWYHLATVQNWNSVDASLLTLPDDISLAKTHVALCFLITHYNLDTYNARTLIPLWTYERKSYPYVHLRRLSHQILEIYEITTDVLLLTGTSSTTERTTPMRWHTNYIIFFKLLLKILFLLRLKRVSKCSHFVHASPIYITHDGACQWLRNNGCHSTLLLYAVNFNGGERSIVKSARKY